MSSELIKRDIPPSSVFMNQLVPLNRANNASPAARYWLLAASVVAVEYNLLKVNSSKIGLAGMSTTNPIKPSTNAIKA
jgi:hypothetical protein